MTIRNLLDRFFRLFKRDSEKQFDIKPSSTTTIIVKVGDKPIGAIQSLSISESRSETGEVSVTAKISRVRFDKMRLTEAFSRGFLHLKSQALPFDIEIIEDQNLITTLKNVWITKLDYTYSVGEWLVTDYMEVEAEEIYSRKLA